VTLAKALIALVGLADTLAGSALLLAPEWFFTTFGHFPPLNRHYMGDTASFLLPIGVGLLIAARDPLRYRPILLLGLLASWLHTLNHGYDALAHPGVGQAGIIDTAQVAALAIALSVGTWLALRPQAGQSDPLASRSDHPASPSA
jgi:hypothetical protein